MADAQHNGSQSARAGDDRRFLIRVILWICVLSLAFILFVIFAPINSWFPAATVQAEEVDKLFKFMLASSGVIFILVQVCVLTFALRFRKRPTDPDNALGVQSHGNARLEIAWTAIPSLLLVVLVSLSIKVWADQHNEQKGDLQLNVRGYQFGWNFALPQYGLPKPGTTLDTVEIPVNRSVYVSETSPDVIHSFWVPEFRMKQDVVPGIVTHEYFTTRETGTFRVICTEFCGSGHSGMVTTIKVVSQAEFENFVRRNGGKLPAGGTTAAVVRTTAPTN